MKTKEILTAILNDIRECRARVLSPETGDQIFRKAQEIGIEELDDLAWLKFEEWEAENEQDMHQM